MDKIVIKIRLKSFNSIDEVVSDEFFVDRVKHHLGEVLKQRLKRPEAPVGYHYKKDGLDILMNESNANHVYFINNFPDIYAKVVRPSNITVSYTDLQNERHRINLSGYAAVIVQHEYDHLEGILFIDHLSTIARLKIRNKLKELQKNTVDGINIRCEE